MASRPHLSITLPRNFQFHYADGQLPKTPEPLEAAEFTEPPQPPKQTYRVKRRRPAIPFSQQVLPQDDAGEPAIPTIETPDEPMECPKPMKPVTSSKLTEGLLSPRPPLQRITSPPKTPVAQISHPLSRTPSDYTDWSNIKDRDAGQSLSRPSSSASGISDSSFSSDESSDSYPSLGGSCTSPESDLADPFGIPHAKPSLIVMSSPTPVKPSKCPKKGHEKWTEELDNHLWITYLMYLQDPVVTPFKMFPGAVPPLGLGNRVARRARDSWKGSKTPSITMVKNSSINGTPRGGSPDTIRPTDSDYRTPTGQNALKLPYKWPHSTVSTRKRLGQLCKQKPSLSAHYSRLLQVRTPSPLQSSSPRPRSTRFTSPLGHCESSFSTRDMNISLVTTTSESMRIGGPLSQLAADRLTPRRHESDDVQRQPLTRSPGHQKSQSLHFGIGLGSTPQPLASPFMPRHGPPIPSSAMDTSIASSSDAQMDHSPLAVPELGPPISLHAPIPLNRSLKRRAAHKLEEEPGLKARHENLLQELFGTPADTSGRRVRHRGFSLDDAGEGARGLSNLFVPPSPQGLSNHGYQGNTVDSMDPTRLVPPNENGASVKRLGSPFNERAANTHFNTFPRNFSPSGEFDVAMNIDEHL
ncbi:MAG: hypothetical protein M1822_005462 [Bathelium mastoideum]|nr:MAG: hypothetical protein M1822_005462 [Bathelium mastoideum]